ncbi:CubicO group peptidase, beta-lactamase class C family [Spirosomataceae bacterium TFI 002]|nr:CubicO group peptidase, beta-lactamase class C family [Spirosomataceae bacterium TFI 002]
MTRKILTFLALFLSITISSFSQKVDEKVKQLLAKTAKENPELGLSIGILNNGEQTYYNNGKISRDSDASKVNSYTVFEIASISKAITANLIAQAVNENKLNLNDYIEDHLPEQYHLKKALRKKVTISDLASHQSGLADIDFRELIAQDAQQPTAAVTKEVLANLVNQTDTLIDHGNYRYSTLGLILLGQVLEEVYQLPYEEIFTKKLITPLSLERTFLKEYNTTNIAQSYNMEGGKQELFKWGVVAPAGLVKSSTSDMLLYLEHVLNPQSIVGKAALLQEHTFYKDQDREIGLGQNIIKDAGNTVYAKTGDTLGQSSVLAYNRDKNWAVVIFMNQNNGKLRTQLFNDIYDILSK